MTPQIADRCEDCGGPADLGDNERVQCECGTTICGSCCEAFEGESFCSECAVGKLRALVETLRSEIAAIDLCGGDGWTSGEERGDGSVGDEDCPGCSACAIKQARGVMYAAQHDASHEQNRHCAKKWLDKHAGGRCPCDRCVRDERRFQERGGSAS